ncbi:MAG TPA: hypothetical protein VN756_09310 [Solirubrobacterales bacterium]|nr:hypothetical protein [Solirubrobacterales bacterium]
MSLDGLRAWIGEVERKLGMRTRVFLVLTVIAIGAAGAGIYLAIDTRDSAVSESDVQALQEQLEAQIGEGGGPTAGAGVAQLEAELKALKAEVAKLEGEGGGATKKGQGDGEEGPASEGKGTGGGPSEGASSGPTNGGANAAKLQELLERAKEQSEKNE